MTRIKRQLYKIALERAVSEWHYAAACIIAQVNGDAAGLDYIRTCPTAE